MKYALALALVSLAAARPIVDISGQPVKEEMYSKRQGTSSMILPLCIMY